MYLISTNNEAHRLKDQFTLESFLLVGGALMTMPNLFVEKDCKYGVFWAQLLADLVLLMVLVRLSRSSYASYKYLFALDKADLAIRDAAKNKAIEMESRYKRMRNVSLNWYLAGLSSGVLIAMIKVLALAAL